MAATSIMSGAMSPPADGEADVFVKAEEENTKPALTPPTSEGTKGNRDDSGSELSDLEPEEPQITKPVEAPNSDDANAEIVPDHYYEDGKIPVFKPTMNQFRSFKDFISKIDNYGMKSGIVKVIPPEEWRDSLPALDEAVKTIRVKNPITQEFHGTHGTYTQANVEKQRSYNLPQWKGLCEESNHQPPAKRGERRRNQEKPTQARLTRTKREPSPAPTGRKRGPGRPRVRPLPAPRERKSSHDRATSESSTQVPPTPKSPLPKTAGKSKKSKKSKKYKPADDDDEPKSGGRQPKSVSSRRLNNKRDQVDFVDEEAFHDFDYRIYNQNEWTTERMQELETAYWRSLNFNNPMYGADMPGSLFNDSTKHWNVAHLENLLDVLGQTVPGVNTAYLYLGMWKASFAWHLEDVDLYSINYIHFGAPKQWYSISQEDARRFEGAMRSVWPTDAKNCDQFLRHKTYLISPQLLQSQYNIKVNRLAHFEGEFVITFPYGYHSGYNLGYNCAESVNFATESWLDFGKVARKCNCEADNVWVDVREIERKLRGEPTPEYYEETDDDDEDDEDVDSGLPTPPGSVKGKPKRGPKRKRAINEKESKPKIKKLKIRVKAPAFEPCILCPNDNKFEELLPTDSGQRAHRICGFYTPETYVSDEPDGTSMVRDIVMIDKARWDLKCNYCRSRKGSVFQCSSKKCTKAYHATCAMPAGIQIDIGPTSVYGEDGTEYVHTGQDFRCRIHRSKRSKNADSCNLENNELIYSKAKKLCVGEAVQVQFYQSDIFAGNVIENRKSEQNVLLDVLPNGDRLEVDWKWLLFFDPVNSQLPVPSEDAKPLPADMLRKNRTTAEDPAAKVDKPKPNEPFCDPNTIYKWSEFESCRPFFNKAQEKIDLLKPEQLWYFLGERSTEAKQYYTHDPSIRRHNQKSNFLELEKLKEVAKSMKAIKDQKTFLPPPGSVNQHAINAARASHTTNSHLTYSQPSVQARPPTSKERPYTGKYAITDPVIPQARSKNNYGNTDMQALQNQKMFQQRAAADTAHQYRPNFYPYDRYNTSSQGMHLPNTLQRPTAPTAPMMPTLSVAPTPSIYSPDPQFDAAALLRKVNLPAMSPTQEVSLAPITQSLYHHQQPSSSRPPAPVANMMSSMPQERPRQVEYDGFERQPDSHPAMSTPPHSAVSTSSSVESVVQMAGSAISAPATKGVSHLKLDPKYIYLHEAEKVRPRFYQSPYAQGGGFTEPYLPVAIAKEKSRPRGQSMSEAYLMARTPSEQDTVNAKVSQEKVKFQQQQQQMASQRRQSIGHQQQHQRPSYQYHRAAQSQPSHLPMSAIQRPSSNHMHPTPSSYFDIHTPISPSYPTAFSSTPTNSYYPPSYHPMHHQPPSQYNQHQLHYTKPEHNANAYLNQRPSLTFQSTHDFQEQMRQEAQRPFAHESSFERFTQQLKDAGINNQSGHAGNSQWGTDGYHSRDGSSSNGHSHSNSGQAGSPLRYELGIGGEEMLPMMP
ncbi:uncharacterized protein KY384_000219 [Bacidia gigantensis]|uniref:uncharacterized protein n=1 Tax=Bacidia gigantensis TaxID=2732470 RepID=UPI001D04CA1E|nr:uncharacterized protein KY384_000219 [Bacidia gigantensis]KAG8526226.1 hypothetical protein KY384_000219 [Bacidia gigantensis]